MKNNLSVIVLLFFVLMVLVGCGQKQEKDYNQVTVVIENDTEVGFDPIKGWGRYSRPLIQSTLLKRDSEGKLVGDLAKNYKISEDGLAYTFEIFDDVKFSDGSSLSGKDIEFTFNKIKSNNSDIDFTNLLKVKAIKNEVVFTLKSPNITFLYDVADTGIVPQSSYNVNYSSNPIGSGPYKLKSYVKGEQAIFEANNYSKNKPNIKQLNIVFASSATALNLAKANKADVVFTTYDLAQEVPLDMHLHRIKTIDARGVTLPVDKVHTRNDGEAIGNDVTSDKVFRQALNLAIDRKRLINDALLGYGAPAYNMSQGLSWNNDIILDYNIEKAKDLLQKNGWVLGSDNILERNGLKAKLDLYYLATDEARKALAYGVKVQLEKIGIKINCIGSNWDEIDKKMFTNPVMMGWGAMTPNELYNIYHSKNAGKSNYYNPQNYKSPLVDKYLDLGIKQTNVEKSYEFLRKAASVEDSGFSPTKEAPWLWLVNVEHLYFVSDRLDIGKKYLEPHEHGWPFLDNVENWKFIK